MRKLNVDDLFEAVALTEVINLNILYEEISKKYQKVPQGEKELKKVGYDIFLELIRQATSKEKKKAIYNFLSRPFECTPEEVGELSLIDCASKLYEAASIKEWRDFFIHVHDLT